MKKCLVCNENLIYTSLKFTGTCNFNKGQYISFGYCGNKNCSRYKLFCDTVSHEK